MFRPLSASLLSASLFCASLFCVLLLAGLAGVARAGDGDELQQRIAEQTAKLDELKAVVAENPSLRGLEGLIQEVEANLRTLEAKARVDTQVEEARARLAKQQAEFAKRRAEFETRRADLARRQAEMATRTGLSTVDLQRTLREKAEMAALRARARQVSIDGHAPDARWEVRFDALRQQLAAALAAKDRRRVKALKAQLTDLEAARRRVEPEEGGRDRTLKARRDALRRRALAAKRHQVGGLEGRLPEFMTASVATARRPAAPRGGPVAKVRHLREAARHLREAGYAEQAEEILLEAARLETEARRDAESAALLRVLRALRQEVGQLRLQVRELRKQLDER